MTPSRQIFQGWRTILKCVENIITLMYKIGENESSSPELQSFINGGFGEKNGNDLFLVVDIAFIGEFRGIKILNNHQ